MLQKWKTQETVQSAAGTDVNTDARGGGGGEGRNTAVFHPDDHKKLHGDHSNGPKNIDDAGTNTSEERQQFQRTTWVLAKRLPPPTLVVAEAPFISANATNPAGRYCGLTAGQIPTACTTQGSEQSAAGATQNRTKVRRAFLTSITEMALFVVGGVFGIIGLIIALMATVAERKKLTAHRPGWWSWPRLFPRRPLRSIGRSYWVFLILFWRPFFFATAVPKGTLTNSEFKLATWGTFELIYSNTPAAVYGYLAVCVSARGYLGGLCVCVCVCVHVDRGVRACGCVETALQTR